MYVGNAMGIYIYTCKKLGFFCLQKTDQIHEHLSRLRLLNIQFEAEGNGQNEIVSHNG